ncbi:hypothetical protein L100_17185, partial [Elizabethkingia meningoseptica ATCC 13253 = NBRC 12535]
NKWFHTKGYNYFMITSLDKLDWKVKKENKKSENIILQKASTIFGGESGQHGIILKSHFRKVPISFADYPV